MLSEVKKNLKKMTPLIVNSNQLTLSKENAYEEGTMSNNSLREFSYEIGQPSTSKQFIYFLKFPVGLYWVHLRLAPPIVGGLMPPKNS